MTLNLKQITDAEFVEQFEKQNLPPEYFDHIGHIRLARLYLLSYDLETAISRISQGIQDYAESLGATNKFHLTITDSIMRIIANRLALTESDEWHVFLKNNADIVEDSLSVLCQYFSKDKLMSERARTSLLSPDIKAIEE